MAKMQFFYIGKSYGSCKVEGDTFNAYRYKDKKTKKITLYPIIPTNWSTDNKKIFIQGMGYKKVGKNVVEVPVFDGDPKHWNEYLEKYGAYCLYYSIDGSDYLTMDCCAIHKQCEFRSILQYGVEGYVDFINNFNKLSMIQIATIKAKYYPLISKYNILKMEYLIDNEWKFTPCFSLYGLPLKYSPNVINDDKCMESLYREYRSAVLKSDSADYQKAMEMEKHRIAMFNELNNNPNASREKWSEYYRLKDSHDELFGKAYEVIDKTVDKEINTDNDVFPTSVADRIRYLFGDEAFTIYNYLVDKYLGTENV